MKPEERFFRGFHFEERILLSASSWKARHEISGLREAVLLFAIVQTRTGNIWWHLATHNAFSLSLRNMKFITPNFICPTDMEFVQNFTLRIDLTYVPWDQRKVNRVAHFPRRQLNELSSKVFSGTPCINVNPVASLTTLSWARLQVDGKRKGAGHIYFGKLLIIYQCTIAHYHSPPRNLTHPSLIILFCLVCYTDSLPDIAETWLLLNCDGCRQ